MELQASVEEPNQILLVKTDVYERYLLRTDLANQSIRRYRNRNVHIGCIVLCLYFYWTVSIYHDVGYLELLILSKSMRESVRGISEKAEHPRLSI